MLKELSVQNLAVIEDVRVELASGFCAWTGETGTGKTLLLSALGLLLGDRASIDLIRAGASELRVTGRFHLDSPQRISMIEGVLEGAVNEKEIILMRRIVSNGRSYAYVNEQPVSIATLKQLGSRLVTIHGQRESQSLLQNAYQLDMLDAFGNHQTLRQKYKYLADGIRTRQKEYADLVSQRQLRQRELALVRFEREELGHAQLVAGEKEALSQERERLMHQSSLREFADTSCARLYDEEGSVFDRLGKLDREAAKWAAIDTGLADVEARMRALCEEVRDVAETIRQQAERWEADPARQEEVENRLHLLDRLEHKYQKSIDELIAYAATLDEQELQLLQSETSLERTQEELAEHFKEINAVAAELSEKRKTTAKRLATEVKKHLSQLGMKDAKLEVRVESISLDADPMTADVPAAGFDRVEIMLAANKGQPSLPLRKVASGGEMSRTMLALKSVLAAQDEVGVMVFDEIDANVGGRLGDVLGQKLANLGRTHQIICVTHLPQVASYAAQQWTIRKQKRGKQTVTSIAPLSEEERLDELASMLRGESKGETTQKEAAAMLQAARRFHRA